MKVISRAQWLPALRDQPPTAPPAAGLNPVHDSVANPHSLPLRGWPDRVTCTNGKEQQLSAVPQASNLPCTRELDLLIAVLLRTARAGSTICVLLGSLHFLPSLLHSPQTSCRGRTLSSESHLTNTPTWKPWSMREAPMILHSSPPDSYVQALSKARQPQFHLLGPSRGQIVWRLRQPTHLMRENTLNPAFLSLIFEYLVISMV